MEQTFQALGGILFKAIPTVIFLLFLFVFLKSMLFGPLERVMKQREEATEGARKKAQDAFRRAEQKAAEYETALREARLEVYREEEEFRRRWSSEQAEHVSGARAKAESMIAEARKGIAAEVDSAKAALRDDSVKLAEQIAQAVLAGRGR